MIRFTVTYKYIHEITRERKRATKVYTGTNSGVLEYAKELTKQGAYDVVISKGEYVLV